MNFACQFFNQSWTAPQREFKMNSDVVEVFTQSSVLASVNWTQFFCIRPIFGGVKITFKSKTNFFNACLLKISTLKSQKVGGDLLFSDKYVFIELSSICIPVCTWDYFVLTLYHNSYNTSIWISDFYSGREQNDSWEVVQEQHIFLHPK